MRTKPTSTPHAALPRDTPIDMTDPCAVLADAQKKYYALLTGGAPQMVETPLIGRVEFTPANIDALARFIGAMQDQCQRVQAGYPAANTLRRRPLSFDTEY